MTLSFDEYQLQAAKTAVYPRQFVLTHGQETTPGASCIYPVFGLCGEIGEVCQVLTDRLGLSVDLEKECGDVLWYIAAICSDLSIKMSQVAECDTFEAFAHGAWVVSPLSTAGILQELFIAAGTIAEATKKTIRDSGGIVTPERLKVIVAALRRVLVALRSICIHKSLNIASAANGNLAKLAARAAKGTIQGSGDNR